jgi:TRAP-type C4-dicarboxylate transport system permease small subunit
LTHWAGVREKWTLVFLVAFLFSFDLLRIIPRNFFATGLVWGDTLSKHLVLWIALLGASRATMEEGHILIDLVPRMLADRGKRIVLSVEALFSFVVCALLSYASYHFVYNEISCRTKGVWRHSTLLATNHFPRRLCRHGREILVAIHWASHPVESEW